MVQTGTNNTDQLTTSVYRHQRRPLLIMPVLLLHTVFHLCHIVGSQGQTLETTTSGHGSTGDEVIQGQPIKGPLRTPQTLCSLEDGFGCWISPMRIVASNPRILDIVGGFEPLEALCPGIVDILGKGDESRRRRRSVGSRHFMWRMGWWCRMQRLMLLLTAHVRHGLIWSSLPLPRDSSVYWLDKPRIFFIHSILMSFGVWCIFIFIWLILVLFWSLLYHPTHSYLLLPHLIFCNSESAYSFYFYLPPCLLLDYGLCAGPTLNMYVYNVWCLLLAFPRLDINLDLSTPCPLYSNLRVVLVDNSITWSWSPVPVCVCDT